MTPDDEDDELEGEEDGAAEGEADLADSWRPKLPPPERAAGVPADATWDDDAWRWAVGTDLADGTRRFWAMNGALLLEREFAGGAEKSMTSYYPDGRIAAKGTTNGTETTHVAYFRDGTPWCTSRYRDVDGDVIAPDQVLSERLSRPDGSMLREVTNVFDENGVVTHTERSAAGLRFENVRAEGGRELRFYTKEAALELTLKWKNGADKALATIASTGQEFPIDAEGIDARAQRTPLEDELGGRLFAVSIKDMPQPDPVKAFVSKNAWAKKVSKEAPFEHASVAHFLTALGSKIPYVADLAGVGLGNLIDDEKHRDAVIPYLEKLGTPAAKHALARLGVDDGEEEAAAKAAAESAKHEGEHAIGKVTLPSGTLAILDMGALGQWSHEAPHHADISGSKWAHMVGKQYDDYVDLIVTGAQAKQALAQFVAAHGAGELFDVLKESIDEIRAHFVEHTEGLDAKLEIAPERIGHGARLRLLKDAGLPYADFDFAHVNVTAVFGLPSKQELSVVGQHDDEGSWDHVSLIVKPTPPVREQEISVLAVEEARFIFADGEALKAWDHERSLDGLRDFVFWGGAEDEIIAATGAGLAYAAADYHGWADLPPGALPPHFVTRVLRQVEAGGLVAEVRPHSSHHAILRQAWQSPDEAGTAVIGGATMCGLFSSVGDGGFPIYLEYDADDAICRVTVKITGAPEDEDEDDDDDDDEDDDEDEEDDEEDEDEGD